VALEVCLQVVYQLDQVSMGVLGETEVEVIMMEAVEVERLEELLQLAVTVHQQQVTLEAQAVLLQLVAVAVLVVLVVTTTMTVILDFFLEVEAEALVTRTPKRAVVEQRVWSLFLMLSLHLRARQHHLLLVQLLMRQKQGQGSL